MSLATAPDRNWIADLPAVRGNLAADAPLHRIAWFRVGGPADLLFHPADADDLAGFLAALPATVPVTVIGVCSNLLVRDGGVRGVVVRLGRNFAGIEFSDDTVRAGGGALDIELARACLDASLAGLEFLCGIPGTIGGALRMNAGAYGSEIADVLVSATAIDRAGAFHAVAATDLGYAYRHCAAPEDWIFTEAVLRGRPGESMEIAARMKEIRTARDDSQPIRSRTGGSTFTNPPDRHAWELVDEAGCRGLTVGGAMVSEQHCNFLVNTGEATAADIEGLGEEVRRRVLEKSGVDLHWEIRRIGEPLPATGAPPAAGAPPEDNR